MTDELAAVLVSDIHLSTKQPICRIDKNWMEVQKRYINQLYSLTGNDFGVPIVMAGDLFDKWNQSPEMINWCIDNLPEMYGNVLLWKYFII